MSNSFQLCPKQFFREEKNFAGGASGGQQVRDQDPHFVLPQRVTSYTWPHTNKTSARFIGQLDLLEISHSTMTMTELYKPFVVMRVISWDFWTGNYVRAE